MSALERMQIVTLSLNYRDPPKPVAQGTRKPKKQALRVNQPAGSEVCAPWPCIQRATRRFMENPRLISGDSLMFSEPACIARCGPGRFERCATVRADAHQTRI